MTEKTIRDTYCRIRTIEQTIPDEILDFMRDASIEKLDQALRINDDVQANTEKICELIRQKFDGWVFGVETQSGEKLKVVDSTDFNQIITEIEKEIKECNIANVSWQSEQLKAFAEMVAKDDFAYLKNAETLLKDFESL